MTDESTAQTSLTQTPSHNTIPDESEQQHNGPEVKSIANGATSPSEPVAEAVTTPTSASPTLASLRDFSKVFRLTIPEAKGSNAASIEHRRAEIEQIRKALTYGPDPVSQVAGETKGQDLPQGSAKTSGPLYPSGPLGNLLREADTAEAGAELAQWDKTVRLTTMKALEKLMHESGEGLIDYETKRFTSLKGYATLYSDELGLGSILGSANAAHWPFKGYLENGASDALFALERLTVQPYSLRRLSVDEKLPFPVPDDMVKRLTNGQCTSLQELHDRRRLLYVDFTSLVDLDRFEGRYSGACEAYFWQDPRDKQGLYPLAILVHPLRGKVVPVPPAVHESESAGGGGQELLKTLQIAMKKFLLGIEEKIIEAKAKQTADKDVTDTDVAVDKDASDGDAGDKANANPDAKAEDKPVDASPMLYTPLDTPAAWTLAKMIFSQNDLFWSAFYHLASTHEVLDIIYLAAARSLNIAHPVFALLSRFTTRTFGLRPILLQKLINKGGPVDQLFPWGGDQAGILTSQLYRGEAGGISGNYFQTDLSARSLAGAGARRRKHFMGLLGPSKLKLRIFQDKFPEIGCFPYYHDAKKVHDALWDCIASMVYSSYASDEAVRNDVELSAFVKEATTPENEDGAGIQDFPAVNSCRVALIDFVTHVAFLSSVKHNVINTNGPAYGLNVLPYHPMSFYKPLPATQEEKAQLKSVDDLVTQGYLPDVVKSLRQIALLHAFARPFYVDEQGEEKEGRTLLNAFDDPDLLRAAPSAFRQAVELFKHRMQGLSDEIRKRNEESVEGGGEPFKWTVLDPKWCPFYAAI